MDTYPATLFSVSRGTIYSDASDLGWRVGYLDCFTVEDEIFTFHHIVYDPDGDHAAYVYHGNRGHIADIAND